MINTQISFVTGIWDGVSGDIANNTINIITGPYDTCEECNL